MYNLNEGGGNDQGGEGNMFNIALGALVRCRRRNITGIITKIHPTTNSEFVIFVILAADGRLIPCRANPVETEVLSAAV